jgi:hypothetical protein
MHIFICLYIQCLMYIICVYRCLPTSLVQKPFLTPNEEYGTYMYMHVYTHLFLFIFLYVNLFLMHMYMLTHLFMYIYMHIYVYINRLQYAAAIADGEDPPSIPSLLAAVLRKRPAPVTNKTVYR